MLWEFPEKGTGKRGMKSALENVYESIVGALYLDAGLIQRTILLFVRLDLIFLQRWQFVR